MVPVFIVGIMGASLASCVLDVVAYSNGKLAYEANGGRGVSGDKESTPASAACCMPRSLSLVSLSPSCLHSYAATSSNLSDRVTMLRLLLGFSFLACFTSALISLAHLYHPSVLGPLFSPGGHREQQTSCMGS